MKGRTRPNGTGTAYKRGKTWTARVVIGWKLAEDGRSIPIYRTKGGFQTKREALEYCQTLRNAPKTVRRLTAEEIYLLWLPAHEGRVGRSTMNCYKAAWKYFSPIYQMPFADIGLDDLQECVDDCPNGKRTKENMKALAGLLMKYAIPRHQTDMNYAEFIHTGNDEKGTRPAFNRDQIKMIDEQIGITPHAEDVYCLIYTGMRPSELFALTKADYRDGILYGGIKTEAGKNRAVPVSPRIAPIIERRLSGDSKYLFPKDDGTQMSAKYFRDNYFYPVLAAAGIQPMPTPNYPAYYVPYSCRHTFANLLKDVPGSDKDKAGLIGHEDYKTTKKLYQSPELEALRSIINAL
jgi:integrase